MIVSLLTQVDLNPETPSSITAAVLGLGTVIVVGMAAALRALWQKSNALQTALDALAAKNAEERTALLREVLSANIENSKFMQEATATMDRSTVLMHQLAGRQFPAEQLTEISYHLRALREAKERAERGGQP